MKVQFDQIHTKKKQELLKSMMLEVGEEVRGIENKNIKLSQCPVCESNKISFFVNAFGFDMSHCDECDLIFCNPYPNNKQLHYYYNSKMKEFENEFFRESFDNRVQLFLPRIDLINKYMSSGSLLDIGSALGIFIEALHQKNTKFDVNCCDLSKKACEELKMNYPDVEVINADFMQLDTLNKYDIITMWDTVEHIVDLNSMFKKIHDQLNNNGLFVFSTPNTDSFEWKIAWKKHVQILPPGHVNLLNIRPIEILLKRNKFKLLDTYTPNASLDITYIEKLIESDDVDMSRLGEFLKESLMDDDFKGMLEKYLIDKKQAGNILVIAQK